MRLSYTRVFVLSVIMVFGLIPLMSLEVEGDQHGSCSARCPRVDAESRWSCEAEVGDNCNDGFNAKVAGGCSWNSHPSPGECQDYLGTPSCVCRGCGNDIKETGGGYDEECDGSDLGGLSCGDFEGYESGVGSLDCTSSCTYDLSGCVEKSYDCSDVYVNSCDSSPDSGTCSGSCGSWPACGASITVDSCNTGYDAVVTGDSCRVECTSSPCRVGDAYCAGSMTCECQSNGVCDDAGCNPADGLYNCADLSVDESVGGENDESGWCPTLSNLAQDGLDNDCDGAVDFDDWDCPVDICDDVGVQGAPTDEGRSCLGHPDDSPFVEQSDGFYCDTNNGNKCCPVGDIWDSDTSSCIDAVDNCVTSPCPYDFETENSQWWSDSSCYSADEGCCYESVEAGVPKYTWQAHQAY